MHDAPFIFRDLAMVIAAVFAFGMLFVRLRQPLLLGYVLAGLILSPLTPGPRVHDVHTFEIMAEAGVILLMFSAGTEFSISELLRFRWIALAGAPLGIGLCIALGVGAGTLMGWPLRQSIAVGCIISVASTMVLMRLLMDCGQLSSTQGRLMITLTLLEDIAVVMLTVLLPGLGGDGGADYGQALLKVGQALLLLTPVMLASSKLVPAVMARVERSGNDEVAMLLALTICLTIAAVTEQVGLSLALGAFLGGLLLGGSSYAHQLAAKTFQVRDVFVALFFASVGMLIDPRTWLDSWRVVVLMVALIVIGKFVIWYGLVRLFGYPSSTALRVGVGLTQIGEFSFILAQVSLRAGLIGPDVYNATLAASLISILINASLFKILNFDAGHRTVARELRVAGGEARVY